MERQININRVLSNMFNKIHPQSSIMTRTTSWQCNCRRCRGRRVVRKERIIEHIIETMNQDTKTAVINGSIYRFMMTPLQHFVLNMFENVQPYRIPTEQHVIHDDTHLNVLSSALVQQKKNGKEYHINFITNTVKLLAETHLSANKLELCLDSFQKCFFGSVLFETPSSSSINRYVKATSLTIDHIVFEKLNTNQYNITRMVDESDGYLSIFYNITHKLSDIEITQATTKLQQLSNQPRIGKENYKLINRLERELRFGYRVETICSEMLQTFNQTSDLILEIINNHEQQLRPERKPMFTVADNGKNIHSYIEKDGSIHINCMGHCLNLVYVHFIETLYLKFESTVAKVIRKFRSSWDNIKHLVRVEKFQPDFIETFLKDVNVQIALGLHITEYGKVSKPPMPVKTRWMTVAQAGVYILDNLAPLLESADLWGVDCRGENLQSTWTDIKGFLQDDVFIEALRLNKIFYSTFLQPCFLALRKHNTIDYLLQYILDWREILNNIQIDFDLNELNDDYNLAIQAAKAEFEKLLHPHLNSSYIYAASLLNNNHAVYAARRLLTYPQERRYGFSEDLLVAILRNFTSLEEEDYFLEIWIKLFGSTVIDNEIVESGFSHFNLDSMLNRKQRGHILKLYLNDTNLWYHACNTTHQHLFHQYYRLAYSTISHETRRDVLLTTLDQIRQEKVRRQTVYGRHFDNEQYLDAVLLMCKAFNVLQTNEDNLIHLTPKIFTKQSMQNILLHLANNNFVARDLIDPQNPGLTGLVAVFNRDEIRQGFHLFVQQEIIPRIRDFAQQSQHRIRNEILQCNMGDDFSIDSGLSTNPLENQDVRPVVQFNPMANPGQRARCFVSANPPQIQPVPNTFRISQYTFPPTN